nr:putative ribonuclease H-like domain-containing protein [Tanacetum cinerariifolium]
MNYQPVVAETQPNDNTRIKENLDADDDVAEAAFDVKEMRMMFMFLPMKVTRLILRNMMKRLKEIRKERVLVNAVSAPVNAARPNPTNITNSFNTASPSVNAVSLNFKIAGTSSFVDPSKYPNDPDMPELEDIVYSDDEDDVGAEADLSNLETNIPVGLIPTTRVHKDHHVTQIIGDLNLAPQTMSMARVMDAKSDFLYETIEEEVYVCQPPGFKDPDYHDKTVVATSSTEAEYIAATSCCAQVLWIQNQLLDYGHFITTVSYKLMLFGLLIVVDVKLMLLVKKVNDAVQLRALIDGKKVVVLEDIIRRDLYLDDADGVECLPNEEIFVELARMRYEKPHPKLTFYKAMVRNVDSPSKFSMYPRFLHVVLDNQVDDMSTHNTRYTSPALTQKVFANMQRVGKGFLGVETLLFASMLVLPQPQAKEEAKEFEGRINQEDVNAASNEVSAAEPTAFDDEEVKMTMAQTLIKLKAEKAKLLDEQIAQKLHDEEVQERHLDNIRKYQNLKKKPVSIAQARKNMIIYLKNMAGYKMENFRGMTYDKIRPIFKRKYKKVADETLLQESFKKLRAAEVSGFKSTQEIPSNDPKEIPIFKRKYKKVQTLFKPDKDVEEPKKKSVADETLLQESFKKLRAAEVSGFKSTQEIPSNDPKEMSEEDEIHTEGSRTYWKIIRVGGITKAYQSFEDMIKGFDREDMVALWNLVKEKFSSAVPSVDKEKALWVELKRLFEPDADDVLWKLQRYMHAPLTWKLYTDCGVHQVSSTRGHDIFMLTEKDYPLPNVVMIPMLSGKLQVDKDNEMAMI